MKLTTESAKIVDALGGVAYLAKKLGMPRPTIQAWKARGIPPRFQLEHPRLMTKGRRLVAQMEKAE